MTTATQPQDSKTTNGNGNGAATTKLNAKDLEIVIDAMRDVQTEGDRWHLSEALAAMIPSGDAGFDKIIDEATAEGVIGNLSRNTLRLYRDTANRWPADKRVSNVSFSAHREAMALPSIDQAVKMLNDLSKTQGASKVTVASVRKAVAIKNGKQPSTRSAGPSTTTAQGGKGLDVLRDLEGGGPQVITAIGNMTDSDRLDKLHAGLTKVIAHVEKLRAKAARAKAKTANGKTSTTTSAKPAEAKPASSRKGAGDMRGL